MQASVFNPHVGGVLSWYCSLGFKSIADHLHLQSSKPRALTSKVAACGQGHMRLTSKAAACGQGQFQTQKPEPQRSCLGR